MKDYELTVLFHPDLEMNLDPALDKVRKLIATSQGEITKEEVEGKRRTAYPINGQQFAIYYFADIKLPADAPSKIDGVLNITDEVIRHLIVKVDPRKAKSNAHAEAKSADTKVDHAETNEEKGE